MHPLRKNKVITTHVYRNYCKYGEYSEYDCSAVSKRKKYINEQYSF